MNEDSKKKEEGLASKKIGRKGEIFLLKLILLRVTPNNQIFNNQPPPHLIVFIDFVL